MARTVRQIIAAVHRKCSGLVTSTDIYESLLNIHRQIYATYVWPWTYAEANISTAATYQVGTITVADGDTVVYGSGTSWNINWTNKKLHFSSISDYEIDHFQSDSEAHLRLAINTGANWTDVAYTIYQEDYLLPSDCEPGDVILIVNPNYRYRLMNPPRRTQEIYSTALGVYFQSFQTSWTDAGYRNGYLIKLNPPPSTAMEYRIVYRRRVGQLSGIDGTSEIPETFDMALEHLTEFEVKRSNPKIFPAQEAGLAKQEGYQVLQNMRRRITTSGSDILAGYQNWPALGESSMVDPTTGLIIQGPVAPA